MEISQELTRPAIYIQRKARSCYHWCNGKALRITYFSVRACVRARACVWGGLWVRVHASVGMDALAQVCTFACTAYLSTMQ